MNFTTDAAAIGNSLRVIRRLCVPTDGCVTLRADGKTLVISAVNEINQCQLVVPGELKGSAEFGVNLDSLDQVAKGRGDVELSMKNTVISIKSKGNAAQLATSDVNQIDDSALPDSKKIKISGDHAAWLQHAVSACSLKYTSVADRFMPIGVSFGKQAFVSCFDDSHMSFISSKEIQGDSEFVVPLDLLAGVLDAFGKQSFVLNISSVAVEVSNKLYKVRLNLPELDDQGPTLAMVQAKAKEIKKVNGTEMALDKSRVVAFLDNSKAVAQKERAAIDVVGDGKKLTMSVTTVGGTVKEVMKCTAKVKFSIDHEFFDEMVRRSSDDLRMKAAGAFLVCLSSKATLVSTFNKE